MKQYAVCTLLLLLLTGCSENREMETAVELRSQLLQAKECAFSVAIHADSGNRIHSFSMDCTADHLGNVSFTVTQPESISGISGSLSADGGRLIFDGTALHFGFLADNSLSPVSAPWILMRTLRSGYIASACRDSDSILLSMDDSYEDDALRLDIRLDHKRLPDSADILYDGRRILTLDVENFVFL